MVTNAYQGPQRSMPVWTMEEWQGAFEGRCTYLHINTTLTTKNPYIYNLMPEWKDHLRIARYRAACAADTADINFIAAKSPPSAPPKSRLSRHRIISPPPAEEPGRPFPPHLRLKYSIKPTWCNTDGRQSRTASSSSRQASPVPQSPLPQLSDQKLPQANLNQLIAERSGAAGTASLSLLPATWVKPSHLRYDERPRNPPSPPASTPAPVHTATLRQWLASRVKEDVKTLTETITIEVKDLERGTDAVIERLTVPLAIAYQSSTIKHIHTSSGTDSHLTD